MAGGRTVRVPWGNWKSALVWCHVSRQLSESRQSLLTYLLCHSLCHVNVNHALLFNLIQWFWYLPLTSCEDKTFIHCIVSQREQSSSYSFHLIHFHPIFFSSFCLPLFPNFIFFAFPALSPGPNASSLSSRMHFFHMMFLVTPLFPLSSGSLLFSRWLVTLFAGQNPRLSMSAGLCDTSMCCVVPKGGFPCQPVNLWVPSVRALFCVQEGSLSMREVLM